MNYAKREPNKYYDWVTNSNKERAMVSVDQQKFNLTWLVFPEIEEVGLSGATDEFIAGLHKFMDKATRAALDSLPLTFMGYWKGMDHNATNLAQGMPADYLFRMEAQAAEAQVRLLGLREEKNVTFVNFRRKA